MNPGEAIVGLLNALDHLAGRVRRPLTIVIPLLLVVLAIVGFALAPRGDGPPPHRSATGRRQRATAIQPAPTVASAASNAAVAPKPPMSSVSTAGTVPGSPDLDQLGPTGAMGPSPEQIAKAATAARAFLAGYLPYSYGHAKASTVKSADPLLVKALAHQPPLIPAARRSLHPRIESLGVAGGQRGEVAFQATVTDGRQTYFIPIKVTRQPTGRWLVTAVS